VTNLIRKLRNLDEIDRLNQMTCDPMFVFERARQFVELYPELKPEARRLAFQLRRDLEAVVDGRACRPKSDKPRRKAKGVTITDSIPFTLLAPQESASGE
jgi:hypothetical protein